MLTQSLQRLTSLLEPANAPPELPYPCYVLSIAEGKHRFLTTQNRLQDIGIAVERLQGVSKFTRGFEEHCLYNPHPDIDTGLSPGAIAVGMTHIHAWSKLIRENIPAAIILEDDAMPQVELPEILTAFEALPTDADFAVLHSWGTDQAHKHEIDDNETWWGTTYCSNTLVAYWLTQQGARHLLRACIPYWQPIDQMVQLASGSMRSYQIRQPLFNADYTMGSLINE